MKEIKKRGSSAKLWAAIIFAFVFIALMLFLFSDGNFNIVLSVFREDMEKDELRDTLDNFGIRGYITIAILSMLQVILTFLPAEPVQVIAGITFGLARGGLICLLGVFIGNTVVYILYKIYGMRLTEWFEHNTEFDFSAASKSMKIWLIVFLLYFLPAIPYGIICFFTASLNFKYPKYIILTTLGSIPSIIIGVGLGHIAIASSWILSLCVFIALVVLLILLNKNKAFLFKKLNEYVEDHKYASDSTVVRRADKLFCDTVALCSKIYIGGKVKIKFKNNVGKLEHPAIVLINHGSFLDFIYAGLLIRKERPNFMVARLYTYNKTLRKMIRRAGAFPKSMFSSDFENAKNCLKVIRQNGVIAMMPEARLSTVGKFEDIQNVTYQFIKKINVPIYTVKLEGDYFAKPKWADKVRRGSVVYSTLDILYTKEQLSSMSEEELSEGINRALEYDEFKWLETKPDIHYKSKTLAEGLENILAICPSCGARHSIATKGATVSCSKCSLLATLDDRYAFKDGKPFKSQLQA